MLANFLSIYNSPTNPHKASENTPKKFSSPEILT